MSIRVTQLNIYPVKSLAGFSLQMSEIDAMGLQYDRRWMIVSVDGRFLTQRTLPQMALIKTVLSDEGQLTLSMQGKSKHVVPLVTQRSELFSVNVWNDTVNAQRVGRRSDQWLTEALGVDCHLVYIAEGEVRQCDLEYSKRGDRTGFADGFPMLLISEASLDDLNNRLLERSKEPVDMRRFRPNIVVSGCDAFAEDNWQNFKIAKIPMQGVKVCSRCPIPTINPDTGERKGVEPMATLSLYRKQENKVYFGMNVIHQQQGVLKVGDLLDVC